MQKYRDNLVKIRIGGILNDAPQTITLKYMATFKLAVTSGQQTFNEWPVNYVDFYIMCHIQTIQ